jgi:predicted ATPase
VTAKPRHNLPEQLSSFVGRQQEIASLRELLSSCRLITLASSGGTGKTRLSLQLAGSVVDDYPDGVWFVELAPILDGQMVPQAVASVLGVIEEAGRPVLEAIEKYVNERKLLLILDNCEHLVHACADLAKKLLRSGKQLQILASSREHLHVAGETLFPLPTLAIPALTEPDAAIVDLDALTQCESVRLFIDRARAAQPAFRLTAANAFPVAEICQQLDGIPLAIELAAARVGALSVEKISSRLNDRFRLLTNGDKTAMPRQQTLRASIDWSYDLLADDERILLQRLSVFAGGCTLEAAEAVGAGGCIDEPAVLELLIRLVEKSLVAVDAGGERYRLLQTVRQYAQERLNESGAEQEVRTRHLHCYLALAEQARPQLNGPEQGAWLARLDLERENLLAAHVWADRAMDGATLGLRLVRALKPYWINRGFLALGRRMTVEALARAGADERNLARCRALFDVGQVAVFMGNYPEAQAYLLESLAIARELGDTRRIAASLQPLGMACLGQGDAEAARMYLQEGLSLAREQGDKREIATALNMFAQFLRVEGEFDVAVSCFEESLAIVRELQDREGIAIGALNLAMVSIGHGALDRAWPMLIEALLIADEIRSKRMGKSVLEVTASLAALRGDWTQTVRFYSAAEAQAAYTGLRRDPADEAFLAPRVSTAREALASASYLEAASAGRALPYDDAIFEARVWLERRTAPGRPRIFVSQASHSP